MREMAAPYTKRLEASPIRTILDRAAALRSEGRTVIPFSAGEPDFPTPSTIKKATQKAIEDDFSHYTSNRGLPQLRELLPKHRTACHFAERINHLNQPKLGE